MTNTEILQALEFIRDTVIQSHVKINEVTDEIYKLEEQVRKNIIAEQLVGNWH